MCLGFIIKSRGMEMEIVGIAPFVMEMLIFWPMWVVLFCIRERCLDFGFRFRVFVHGMLLYIDMRKTNILWFLVAFIVLVIGYNMVFNDPKEGYHGHGGHHGGGGHGGHHGGGHGGGNHVYHSYGGHGGYYGNGYRRDYGRDYGYDRRGSGGLMTFYLLYPFLIIGAVALFLRNRQ